jgi:phosphoglycolate phosphatase
MRTLAVTWGYLGDGEAPQAWGADAVIDHPAQVLQHL